MMEKVKWFAFGFFLAIVLVINGIEFMHLKLEAEGNRQFCSMLMEGFDLATGQKRGPINITHTAKIVYKFFSIPVKTIWIGFADVPNYDVEEFVIKDKVNPWSIVPFNGWED